MKKMTEMPVNDRPREKMQAKGSEALSDLELLAVLLGSGTNMSDPRPFCASEFMHSSVSFTCFSFFETRNVPWLAQAMAAKIAACVASPAHFVAMWANDVQ